MIFIIDMYFDIYNWYVLFINDMFYHRIFFSLSNYNWLCTLYFNPTDFSIFSNVWIHIHRSTNDQSINQKTTPTMAGDRRWPGVKALDNLTWGTLFTWGKKGVGWIMTNDVLCFYPGTLSNHDVTIQGRKKNRLESRL